MRAEPPQGLGGHHLCGPGARPAEHHRDIRAVGQNEVAISRHYGQGEVWSGGSCGGGSGRTRTCGAPFERLAAGTKHPSARWEFGCHSSQFFFAILGKNLILKMCTTLLDKKIRLMTENLRRIWFRIFLFKMRIFPGSKQFASSFFSSKKW